MFQEGDLVQVLFVEPPKGQAQKPRHRPVRKSGRKQGHAQNSLTLTLKPGLVQNTPFGSVTHDEIIGKSGAPHLSTSKGVEFYAVPPTIADATLAFPRGAAIIYPKDASQIVTYGDIKPGSNVLECGLGSGALTCSLLRAVGGRGRVVSVEKREDFAKTAQKNIANFFGETPANWQLVLQDFTEFIAEFTSSSDADVLFERVVLDLLNPWDFLDGVYQMSSQGGVLTCYITTITQMQTLAAAFEARPKMFAHVECFETIRRPWHLDGLSIRPEHQGIMHSGFIFTARVV
jgi:tRNA (adenine57-N1/adenine58-N1)-methyltransferase